MHTGRDFVRTAGRAMVLGQIVRDANRVISAWNSLSDYIATSPTVACFKRRIAELKFML